MTPRWKCPVAAVLVATLYLAGAAPFAARAAEEPTKKAGKPKRKQKQAKKPPTAVYASVAEARKAGPDYDIQGEYQGTVRTASGEKKIGVQVIALGKGAFQAVFLPGGLPAAGWDGRTKVPVDGALSGDKAVFAPSKSAKKYLGGPPAEFSAVRDNPPEGQKAYAAGISGGVLTGTTDKGEAIKAEKVIRKSPTLGAAPPAGATMLFDGTGTEHWQGGRLDAEDKVLCTDGKDIRTRKKYMDYTLHLEFMLPFRPGARGQGRGNSGCYMVDHYEVQVLDSFGLAGLHNECAGIYKKAQPRVNMCFPPLTWQTYDIEFRNARRSPDGRKTASAVITMRHNGVVVHENVEITGPTGGNRSDPEGTPGPVKLQGHGNPLQYRNIWIIEKE